MILTLHILALVLYATAWLLQLRGFRGGREPGRLEVVAVAAGLAVHALGLLLYALSNGSLPLQGLGPASSSLALAIALFALAASARSDLRAAGLFMLPMVLLLLGEAVWVGIEPTGAQIERRCSVGELAQ